MKAARSVQGIIERLSESTLKKLDGEAHLVHADQPVLKTVAREKCIAIAENYDSRSILECFSSKGYRYLIQNTQNEFEREVQIANQLISAPEDFLANPFKHIFESRKIENILNFNLSRSGEKQVYLSKIADYLSVVDSAQSITGTAALIADELFTNALYNAPANKSGQHLNRNIHRAIPVSLPEGMAARLFLCHSEDYLLIGCLDPFGSIDDSKFISHLLSCHKEDQKISVSTRMGGAGIGCYLMLDTSIEFYVVVEKGVRTLFCLGLPLGTSLKKIESTYKNVFISVFK